MLLLWCSIQQEEEEETRSITFNGSACLNGLQPGDRWEEINKERFRQIFGVRGERQLQLLLLAQQLICSKDSKNKSKIRIYTARSFSIWAGLPVRFGSVRFFSLFFFILVVALCFMPHSTITHHLHNRRRESWSGFLSFSSLSVLSSFKKSKHLYFNFHTLRQSASQAVLHKIWQFAIDFPRARFFCPYKSLN